MGVAKSVICAGAVANCCTVIGTNVILNTGCTVDHDNSIGDHVHIAPGVQLGGEVVLGDRVLVGIGATVMPRRRVGAWTVVGAGALVHTDLPESITAAGIPTRVLPRESA